MSTRCKCDMADCYRTTGYKWPSLWPVGKRWSPSLNMTWHGAAVLWLVLAGPSLVLSHRGLVWAGTGQSRLTFCHSVLVDRHSDWTWFQHSSCIISPWAQIWLATVFSIHLVLLRYQSAHLALSKWVFLRQFVCSHSGHSVVWYVCDTVAALLHPQLNTEGTILDVFRQRNSCGLRRQCEHSSD